MTENASRFVTPADVLPSLCLQPGVLDVRLVVTRSGLVRVAVEGRPVAMDPAVDHAAALRAFVARLEAEAWARDVDPAAVLVDPDAGIFTGRPPETCRARTTGAEEETP